MVQPTTCIWCGGDSTGASPEHVIPEALGCPENAVLRNGEVCDSCNHGVLASLDQALVASLDLPRWEAGVKGKKGKPPKVSTRSNVYAETTSEGPVMHINFGPQDVVLPGGRVLKAPTKSANAVCGGMHIEGKQAVIHNQAQVLHLPDCARALHKIAVEAVALILGRDVVLQPSLDAARQYAREGKGSRQVLLLKPAGGSAYVNQLYPPYTREGSYCVAFKLCGIEFVVDCSPEQASLPDLKASLRASRGDVGWSWLPIGP